MSEMQKRARDLAHLGHLRHLSATLSAQQGHRISHSPGRHHVEVCTPFGSLLAGSKGKSSCFRICAGHSVAILRDANSFDSCAQGKFPAIVPSCEAPSSTRP